MNEIIRFALIFLGAFLVYNIVLVRFIGLCPYFGVSNKVSTATGMGMAVIFVMTMATAASWILRNYVLLPLGVEEFLYIPTFILVIASLVQFEELFIRKISPTLYQSLGIYLPLITTNCAVLAAATEGVKPGFLKLNIAYHFSFLEAIMYTFSVALGFTVVIIIFSVIRERLDLAPIPKHLKGAPISFITAALMSLAFIGFANLFGV